MEATFFITPTDFRRWLEENQASTTELLLGFYKKNSNKPGITYAQALDEALCYGWIDGVRRSLDETSYTIRFTPRKASSIWSNVNIKRAEELIELGLMQPAGLKAFNKRRPDKSGIYSFETDEQQLDTGYEEQFRARSEAWAFFQSQPPYYQKTARFWVMSAKKEETRLKRLATLIEDSSHHRRLKNLSYGTKPVEK
ncbi:MAG TPA: YdeI/OmpD-associated family protein [Ktedonobacteraceae bacterium]|nr:YdeI/OmpD-associated family protein [Ktedonobacteraceae bacterium]